MLLNRRFFCCGAMTTAVSTSTFAATSCEVFTKSRQLSLTAEQALLLLKEGNERFISNKTINCDLLKQVRETAEAQAPIAAIVSCIDSRVPPEFVFDQGIGAIFTARIAGNFINKDILGSLEFATKVAGAKVIVVLGHSECGAIKGAIDNVKLGNLTAMLENFTPAIHASAGAGERSSQNKAMVSAVTENNVIMAVKHLTDRSPVLKEMVAKGEIKIVGAISDLQTGKIVFVA